MRLHKAKKTTQQSLDDVNNKLNLIITLLRQNQTLEVIALASLDETLAAVQAESTVDDSIIALVQQIKAQLDQALAGGLTPEAQAKVDAIFAGISANKDKVAAAVTANTPAAPTA